MLKIDSLSDKYIGCLLQPIPYERVIEGSRERMEEAISSLDWSNKVNYKVQMENENNTCGKLNKGFLMYVKVKNKEENQPVQCLTRKHQTLFMRKEISRWLWQKTRKGGNFFSNALMTNQENATLSRARIVRENVRRKISISVFRVFKNFGYSLKSRKGPAAASEEIFRE